MAGSLLERLDLRDATAVVHDWGGPIGLRCAVEHPDRFSRLVLMDTGMFTGEQPMSEAWHRFRNFVERTEDLPVSLLVRNACARGMDDEVAAGYDAPFPTLESKAGARAFPLILPTSPQMPGAAAGKRALEALRGDSRPALVLWADSDPVLPFEVGEAFARLIGADPPKRIENASHFLQEDAGKEIGGLIAGWLQA
jgi:haloalkane dehalogenase